MGIAIQDLWDRSPFSLSELMTIGLSALVLATLVLPMGYVIARLIQLDAPSLNYRIFIWAALGTSAVIVVWTWVYMLGGAWATVRVVLVVPVLLSSIYFLVDVGRRLNIDFLAKRHHLVRLLATSSLLLLVAMFYLAPRTVDGEISQRQLMGPDSVGYSNAVSALLKRGSFFDLERAALAAAEVPNTAELLGNRQIFQIADKGLSVSAEFIVGAYRVGFPAVVASVVGGLGLEHLFSAMYLTVAFYVVIGVMLMIGLLRSAGLSHGFAAGVSTISALNLSLLVGVHEGGVAQGFVYSSLTAFLAASLDSLVNKRFRYILYLYAMIVAISSYIDLFFIYLIVTFIWYSLVRIRRDEVGCSRVRLAARATVSALLLLLPISLRLPSFLVRRLADARQAGWTWDSWTELTGILGIDNPYSSPPDSLISQLALVALAVMLYGAVKQSLQQSDSRIVHSFAIALTLFGLTFYVYSRYLMGHSTYQWFKLVGTVLGPSSVVLLSLAAAPRIVSSKSAGRLASISLSLVSVLAISASVSYLSDYFRRAERLSPNLVQEILRTETELLIGSYALVGDFEWSLFAVSPLWSAQFLNSYDNDPRINPAIADDRPVALLLRKDRCGEALCKKVPRTRLLEVGESYFMIDLGMRSSELRVDAQDIRLQKVNAALKRLGLRSLEKNWKDFVPSIDSER